MALSLAGGGLFGCTHLPEMVMATCLGFSLSLGIAAGGKYFCYKTSTLIRGKTGHLLPYLCTCEGKLKTI